MIGVSVLLNSSAKVKKFVEVISAMDGQFELHSGRQVLDAKSILGIYCLDLSRPLLLKIEENSDVSLEKLKEFIVLY